MKKHIALIFIILATVVCTISCASKNASLKNKIDKGKIYKDKIFMLSEVDTPPRIIKTARPFYPTSHGKFSRVEGKVVVRFIIDEKGFAKDPEVVESVPAGVFDKSALTALKQGRFKPATKNGVPVDCLVELPTRYYLNKFNHSKLSDVDARIYAFEYCYTRGLYYLKTGEYYKAIRSFNYTINFNRQYSPCYYRRGIAYMNLGIYEKAVSDFNKAIKLAPGIGLYYKLRGQAYSKLKDTKDMCIDLKKACELGDCMGFNYAKKAGKCTDDSANAKLKN